jgi:hypothetical protein
MFLFGVFGDVRREFMQRLSAAIHGTLGWVPISVTLCRRAVLMMWHASLLGLCFFIFSSYCWVVSAALSCKNI